MPQAYVKKLARKHGDSTQKAEGKWAKAKAAASAQGHEGNYAYVTSIFKNMMHESPYIPTLKDLTNGMSFKYFLVAESDDQPAKVRSAAWQHLEKFPQFNELPFKARRELEKEVDSEGLIQDYDALEAEEKESVDDALRDMVIDKLSSQYGGGHGVNIGDWSSTAHDEPEDDFETSPEAQGERDEEPGDGYVAPPKKRERAPRHIAAMRPQPAAAFMASPEPESTMPEVGTRKSYYKPWKALSDEQRAGRAKLASKHGKLYRMKNTSWFKALSPEQQHQAVEAVKAGQEVPKF